MAGADDLAVPGRAGGGRRLERGLDGLSHQTYELRPVGWVRSPLSLGYQPKSVLRRS
jgi:hypothetical protein